MWEKQEIVELNKSVGGSGKLLKEDSLVSEISAQKDANDWISQLAHVMRALLVGHAFKNRNEPTAVAVMVTTFDEMNVPYDPYAVDNVVIRITRKRIKNISTIRSMVRDAIR